MVSVAGTAAPLSAADVGLTEQPTVAGEPTTLHPRLTVPLNPFVGATDNGTVAFVPGVTEISDVADVIEKSVSGLLSAVLSVIDDGAYVLSPRYCTVIV